MSRHAATQCKDRAAVLPTGKASEATEVAEHVCRNVPPGTSLRGAVVAFLHEAIRRAWPGSCSSEGRASVDAAHC